jgi:photosystem II stability/assembly factor-like uncharacterized protein
MTYDLMKSFIIILFAALLASISLAQDQTQQQTPPSVQTDTTSGWQLVFSNPRYSIGNLQYFGGENSICYVLAFNGSRNIILKSTNKGLSWDSIPSIIIPSGLPTFYSPSFALSPAVSQNGVWKTTDSGNSWTPHDRMSAAEGPLAFANQDTAVIFGVCCTARTTDAGNTWKEITTFNDINKNGASFANSQIGYVVGATTAIPSHPTSPDVAFCEKTTDGGATWTQVYTGISSDLQCCQALDGMTLIAGEDSKISRTLDGGITWFQDTVLGFFEQISFANKKHGIIVGGDGPGSKPYGVIYSTMIQVRHGKSNICQMLQCYLELLCLMIA